MPNLKPFLKSTFFIIFLCLSTGSFAQSNFYKFNFGVGFGTTLAYADTKKSKINFAGSVNLDYYFTPYTSFGTEIQKGKLEGGEGFTEYLNNYTTVSINGKVHLGEFLSRKAFNNFVLNSLRGAYVGAGIGLINSNVAIINQNRNGRNKDLVFPFNAGINFYIPNHWGYSRVILNLNLQGSTSLEDGMDGDLDSKSNFNDIYNYFSVGVKYNFGPLGLYQKR